MPSRRELLAASTGAMVLGGCLGRRPEFADGPTDTPAQATNGWPTFGRDHQHTGVDDDGTGPRTDTVAWNAISDARTVPCSPTVVDGTVYVGSAAKAVHAIDAVTGEEKWRYDTKRYVGAAPAVHGDTVYTADADGVVYAVSTDGQEQWTHPTNHNFHSRAVAVHEDTLVVGTAGTMPRVVRGDTDETREGVVIGLDIATGEEQWSFSGPADWFTGPTVGGGLIYIGNHNGTLFALDPANGEEVWRWISRDMSARIEVPPTYHDETIYVGVHVAGTVVAIDAVQGTERWSKNLKAANVRSSPAVDEDRVYIGATGQEASDYDSPDESNQTPTSKSTPNDTLGGMGVSATTGHVFALAAADGSTEWRHETDHDIRSSPAVVGDHVYIVGGDRFLAFARSDGTKQWHVPFEDIVDSSPAVLNGRAYIGSGDGHLYCIGEGT